MTDFSGKVLADKYLVNSIMREGVLGNLYYGVHQKMEKPVTIKILHPSLAVDENIVRRFSEEAKILSRITHPNVLNVTDSGTDRDGTEFIVYESAEGQTLKEAIQTEGRFSLERANRIVRQIAAALSVAHSNNVTHQNLTSENIVLTKTAMEADHVKVLNFGTSVIEEEVTFGEELSTTDTQYLSPEQCTLNGETDARSDIYSLGVILYEMLAGEVPFTGEKPSDIMLKHAQEPPLPLSAFRDDLPSEVEPIVLTALAKNPDARYQTANGLAAALNRVTALYTDSEVLTVVNPNLSRPAASGLGEAPENNIWKTAFIVLAGIAVLGSFFIYMTQVKQTNPPTQLQTDANGLPVQPVNPPVGTSEQSLSNMGAYSPEMLSNSSTMVNGMPQVLPGGDGYDPWARGGIPPQGAPQGSYPTFIPPPTGQVYDGNVNPNSVFMQDGNTYILVPKNSNTNVNTQPQKKPAANANAQPTPGAPEKPAPTPAANTATPAETKPTPGKTKPSPKPTPQPKTDAPQKPAPSGKELDT